MKKFRQITKIEKDNMPEYQYKFLYKRVLPGFLYILGGAIILAILSIIIGLTAQNELIIAIPVIVWAVSVVVLLILFIKNSVKLSHRLNRDRAAEFTDKFPFINPNEAKKHLEERNILCNGALITENNEKVPLTDCSVFFHCRTFSGMYFFQFLVFTKYDSAPLLYECDADLCSFFAEWSEPIVNKELFMLFMTNKPIFTALLHRYNDPIKMQQKWERRKTK